MKVKFANETEIEVSSVTESYRPDQESAGRSPYTLNMEGKADKSIEEYKGLITAEGALGTITVFADGAEPVKTVTGYAILSDLSIRLTPLGEGRVSIMLEKGEA